MSNGTFDHNNIQQFLFELSKHGRTDCFSAFNTRDGKGYAIRKQEIAKQHIHAHVINSQPIAIYLFSGEHTRLAGLDIDNHGGELDWQEVVGKIQPVIKELHSLGLKPFVVRSGGGSGLHIWLAWKEPQLVSKVRRFLTRVLAKHEFKHGTTGVISGTIEMYPKQDTIPDGKYGNPLALPFARKSSPLDNDLQPILLDEYRPPQIEDLYCPSLDNFGDEFFKQVVMHSPSSLDTSPLPDAVLKGDESEVEAALKFVDADDTGDWIRVAYALKQSFGSKAFGLFDSWSSKSIKYPGPEKCRSIWEGLEPDGRIGIGSVFYLAQQNGWNGPSDPAIRKMNAKYGILTYRNKTVIIEKDDEYGNDIFNWVAKFSLIDRHSSECVIVSAGNGETVSTGLVKHWLSHPKASHYRRVDFNPAAPPGGDGPIWNLWRGFAAESTKGDWSLLKEHIFNNICTKNEEMYEWTLNWMAFGVQCPADVIGTAIVLRGLPGTGKGVFVNAYGSLWGEHFVAVTENSQVKGRFNSHLFGRRLVYIDEGTFGGSRQDAGILKARITEKFVMLEAKGVDAIKIENRMIFMVTSNEDSVIAADLQDRRWQFFDVGDRNKRDLPYFAAIEEQLDTGGREAMLYELLHRDISHGPNPKETIKTAGLFDQVIQSQGPEIPYIFQFLDDGVLPQSSAPGNRPGVTTIMAMYEELLLTLPSAKYVQRTRFGKLLRRVFPKIQTVQSGTYQKGHGIHLENRRSTRYTFPDLAESRKQFERFIGQTVPWSNEMTEWQSDSQSHQTNVDPPF